MIWLIAGGIAAAVVLSAWCIAFVLRGIFKILYVDYHRPRGPPE